MRIDGARRFKGGVVSLRPTLPLRGHAIAPTIRHEDGPVAAVECARRGFGDAGRDAG